MTMRSVTAGKSVRGFISRYMPSDCCDDPWDDDEDYMEAAARVGAINQEIRDELGKISRDPWFRVDTPGV